MSLRYPKKYYIIFTFLALITAFAMCWGAFHIVNQNKVAHRLNLERTNRDAAKELEDALINYATLLSGLKSYINISGDDFEPSDIAYFLEKQLEGLSVAPPFSVSYIDTNHVFQYNFTKDLVDPTDLVGSSIKDLIGNVGVVRMDSLMLKNEFFVSNPTNLLEGYLGLPLGFGILDKEGKSLGYISSVALLGPIVEKAYSHINTEDFVLRFQSGNGDYFDRKKSYNGHKIYAKDEDTEYFKNFDAPDDAYISTIIPFYNTEFILSTAYKNPSKSATVLFVSFIVWYFVILGFTLFLVIQYYVYKRKNETIAVQKLRLSELVATKNKFFSIIAHDLRSPLSSVINFLDLLKDEEFKNDQTNVIIESLEDSSRNSIALLDNLLKWSRLQTDQIKFEPTSLDIMSITKDQIKVQNEVLEHKGLNVRLESSFKGGIKGDKNMIATIIRNLLSNAIKFSHENDIIVIELNKVGKNFMLSVEDNGIGIPDNYQKNLFDLTEMTIQPGTRNEKGSGLGLILSKEFTKTHKGELTVESEFGKGTIVTLTLPLD